MGLSGLSGIISFGLMGTFFFVTGGMDLRGIRLTLGIGSTLGNVGTDSEGLTVSFGC